MRLQIEIGNKFVVLPCVTQGDDVEDDDGGEKYHYFLYATAAHRLPRELEESLEAEYEANL